MTRSFNIPDSISLEMDGQYLDLHNSFRLKEIKFDEKQLKLVIRFEKENGPWVGPKTPEEIALIFAGVSVLEYSFDHLERAPADLEEIGFKSPGDYDYDWLLNEQQSQSEDHLVLRFVTDDYLRVSADDAELRVVK